MATQAAPLAAGHKHEEGPLGCPVFRMLPPPLQEESRNAPFLWEYLHSLSLEEIGLPDYAPSLGREHEELARPNLVYPTDGGLYAHILPDLEDSRDFYVAIEPTNAPTLPELMDQVDARLVDLVEALEAAEDSDQRTEVLLKCLDEMCTFGDRRDSWLRGIFKRNGKLHVEPEQMVGLRYFMVRDKVGLGVLEPLIQDPYIEDVSCSGLGHLFLEHRVFGGLKASIDFPTKEELDRFVVRLSEKIGRPVTYREPIIDAVLPDGSRVNIVFGEDVSRRGSNFTIRKFAEKPMSVLDLIETGSLNYEIAAYLSFVLREGMNVFISGETASGKTTLLNAITTFIDPNAKIVSIEDTPELQVPHPNWVREVSRGGTKDAFASSVTMMDLLKAALRQRPNEIIIGEIRGEEGSVAFQAMQTGHACMATFHASTVEKLIQRLTGSPINIPKVYIDNLNVVVITSSVRLPNGKTARRVISISEITRYDSVSDSFSFVEIFRWDPTTDEHEFVGYQNSYLLEQVIAPKRGFPPHDKYMIYAELEQRANSLAKIHEKEITDFYELYNVLSKAYREGLFR